MLRRSRKFEDIPTIDKVFEQNIKRPLKISAERKARQVVLRFREAFNIGCYFRERRKNSPKEFARFKPLLGRPNRSIFFSDANFSFILLLKHSLKPKEVFQIISQETIVWCP